MTTTDTTTDNTTDTTTDTIILSKPGSPLSITHHFPLALYTSQYITTIGCIITSSLDHSAYTNNTHTLIT